MQFFEKKGNSWGTDKESGKSCKGCGPQQQFIACSDISIKKRSPITDPPTTTLENLSISKENLLKLDQSSSSTSKKKASAFQWSLLVCFFVDSFLKENNK